MGVGDWYREKREAQSEYDYDRISREKYELRNKFAIGMIYKCGDENDKEVARRMAKAHGYDMEELIEIVS
ncbi:MAG: hypothetical protein K2G45_01320 [Lachnospiraceae bacterium]|nr:hypothetical protein [Lachnospiraceae bacterium]